MNRIDYASTAQWWQDFDYDIWANLKTITASGAPSLNLSFTANKNNRIDGWCYDAAGNLLHQGACPGSTYAYDAENRLKTYQGSSTYYYNNDGQRVKKVAGSTTIYVTQGITGNVLSEIANGAWSKDYIYLGGQLLATESSSQGTRYHFADHLGTPRLVVNDAGGIICNHDYYPFGQERTVCNDGETHKFTGQERDSESGLDYYIARQYVPSLARWISPDPEGDEDALVSPQSWNLYTYVGNNPIEFFDPAGGSKKKWIEKFVNRLPGNIQKRIKQFLKSPVKRQLEAYKNQKKILADHIRRKGPDHPETQRLKQELDAMEQALRSRGIDPGAAGAVIPLSDLGEKTAENIPGKAGELVGEAIDFVNPLSTAQDLLDVLDALTEMMKEEMRKEKEKQKEAECKRNPEKCTDNRPKEGKSAESVDYPED